MSNQTKTQIIFWAAKQKPKCVGVALFLQGSKLVVSATLIPRLNRANEAKKYVRDVGGSDFADNQNVSD